MRRLLAIIPVLLICGAWIIQAPSGGGGGTTPTWNPSDNTGTTLSNANRTATMGGSGVTGVRSATSHTTGKYYTEVVVTTSGSANTYEGFGLCTGTQALGSVVCGSQTATGIVYTTGGTNSPVWSNFSEQDCGGGNWANVGYPVTGDTMAMEVDLTNSLIWFRLNHSSSWGAWNGSNCAGAPASGTGGISISAFTGVALFLVSTDYAAADVHTIPNSYIGSPDSGFSAW